MLVKQGESRQLKLTSGTYDGIYVGVYLQAALVNVAIGTADWTPGAINVKAILKRDKQPYMIFQDNLLLLGTGNSILQGKHFEFHNGVDLVYAAGGVKNIKLHPVFLQFGGVQRIAEGEELHIEFSVAKSGAFTSNVDATVSYIEFEASACIGYETGIWSTQSEVIQSASNKQPFNLGDNVTDIVVLNFDKNTLTDQVIVNAALQSDRLDLNMNFNQIIQRNILMYDHTSNVRYGSVLPIHATDATGRVFRGLDQYPQTFILLKDEEVDNARLHLALNSSNVAASQNYVFWRKFHATQEMLIQSEKRQRKHFRENIVKLPATL